MKMIPSSPHGTASSGERRVFDRRVESALAPAICSRLHWGYGVVFPDCDWSVRSAEWEQEMVADARTMRAMEPWLSGLFCYWRGRSQGKRQGLSGQALDALEAFLRPDFDVGIPLHVTLDELKERVASFTEDQLGLLDVGCPESR